MKFTDKIVQFNDVLPDSMFNQIEQFLLLPKWGLSVSDPYQPNKKLWGMSLNEEPFFNTHVFNIIKEKTNKNFKIIKILANAQTTLQDGTPHVDNELIDTKTFILYVNKTWDYLWGGQTIFFDRYRIIKSVNNEYAIEEIVNSQQVYSLFPAPNSAVMFPSNMIHFAAGPTRDFYGMRYTIAYHLQEI